MRLFLFIYSDASLCKDSSLIHNVTVISQEFSASVYQRHLEILFQLFPSVKSLKLVRNQDRKDLLEFQPTANLVHHTPNPAAAMLASTGFAVQTFSRERVAVQEVAKRAVDNYTKTCEKEGKRVFVPPEIRLVLLKDCSKHTCGVNRCSASGEQQD